METELKLKGKEVKFFVNTFNSAQHKNQSLEILMSNVKSNYITFRVIDRVGKCGTSQIAVFDMPIDYLESVLNLLG